MRRSLLALLGAALMQTTPAFGQAGSTGVLHGTVHNSRGVPLAGAVVIAFSESLIGSTRSATTDAAGRYRLPALMRGTYRVTITLAGFRPAEGSARLQLRQSVRLDAILDPGAASEAPTPAAGAVARDTPVAATHLSSDSLGSTPIAARFGPGAMLLAPGLHPDTYSAYGSPGAWSNAYRIDDLDGADPEGGRAWVFPALNWLDEVRVVGPGAGAEQGGFTGASSETVLRSGTNSFHGLAETLYRNMSLTDTNVTPALLAANRGLSPGRTDLASDSSVQLGGPLVRDALWFFTGAQFYYARETPGGYPAAVPSGIRGADGGTPSPSESSPRVLFKPTWRWSDRNGLSGFVHSERDVVQARGAAPQVSPDATLGEHSATTAWNVHLTRVLSTTTVLDASYSGFHGADDLVPYNGATPGWYDVAADYYSANSYYFYGAARNRHHAQAELTKSVGAHDLAFGTEANLGTATTRYGYPGGRSVDAASGVPFFVYLWDGSRKDNRTVGFSGYGRDSWRLRSGLTMDAGVRLERASGVNRHANKTLYAMTSVAPRAGLAWDVRGNGATVLRGHYGVYYDSPHTGDYDAADPNIAPLYGADIDRRLNIIGPVTVVQPGTNHTVAGGLDAPRTREAIVGLDHALFHGLVAGIYGIDRRSDRFIDDVLQYKAGDFVKTTARDVGPDGFAASGDETANTTDLYNEVSGIVPNGFLITNPPGAFRNYRGLEVTATKRMTGRWDVQGSWVMSRATGNYDTNGPALSLDFETPNTDPALQPLRTGRVANDTTHLAKVFGSYRLPLRVLLSGALYYTSGRTFTRTERAGLNQGRVDVFIERRGSQRYDPVMRLDARVQRAFSIAGRRVRLELDGFNVLNDATVTSRVSQSGLRYAMPLSLVESRRFRIGAVYQF